MSTGLVISAAANWLEASACCRLEAYVDLDYSYFIRQIPHFKFPSYSSSLPHAAIPHLADAFAFMAKIPDKVLFLKNNRMDFKALFPKAETENPFEPEDSTSRELLGMSIYEFLKNTLITIIILTPNFAGNFLNYLAGVDRVDQAEETYWTCSLILEAHRKTGQVPTAIRRLLRDLFSQVASDPGRDISREIRHLDHDTQALLPGLLQTATLNELSLEDGAKDTKPSLLAGWVGQYDRTALETLQGVIRDYEKDPNFSSKYYAKVIPFIQSSGMGKSRLADELGKICPMVNYIVRTPSQAPGFPDADREIGDLLFEYPTPDVPNLFDNREHWEMRMSAAWNHGTVLALLQASFEHSECPTLSPQTNWSNAIIILCSVTEWMDWKSRGLRDLEHVASSRHTDMAPSLETGNRSLKRAEFCERVCSRARKIRGELIHSEPWRRAFNNVEFASAITQELNGPHFPATYTLRKIARNLCMKLLKFRRQSGNDPVLVFVLDELSSPLRLGRGSYATFNRVIALLKDLPIWFLYLSTECRIERIFPTETSPPTGNYVTTPSPMRGEKDGSSLARPTPFLAFPLDVRAHMLLLDKDKGRVELNKPFMTFDKPENLVLYGRPIWALHKDQPKQLLSLAKTNLLGRGESYDPTNEDHVFSILSFRVLLNICTENPKAASLAKRAVDGSMQVVTSIHPVTGAVRTVTPSEPILAVTAILLLLHNPSIMNWRYPGLSTNNWSESTRTLCQKLLHGALVEKGLKGELYARWMLTLARDACNLPGRNPVLFPPLTFTVELFLTALYGLSHPDLDKIDRNIREAKMNFTHFVAAGENLSPGVMSNLTHELLQRCAAMQLAFNQPTYDLYLPYYFGAEDEQFDPEKAGGILVKVNNKETATSPKNILKEEFFPVDGEIPCKSAGERDRERDGPYFIFQDPKQPLLLLIMDLGVSIDGSTPRLQVSRTNKDDLPVVWAIHSRGYDAGTFRCLTHMNCEPVYEQLFQATSPHISNHDICALRNDRFAKLGRGYRYPKLPTSDDSNSKRLAQSATSAVPSANSLVAMLFCSAVTSGIAVRKDGERRVLTALHYWEEELKDKAALGDAENFAVTQGSSRVGYIEQQIGETGIALADVCKDAWLKPPGPPVGEYLVLKQGVFASNPPVILSRPMIHAGICDSNIVRLTNAAEERNVLDRGEICGMQWVDLEAKHEVDSKLFCFANLMDPLIDMGWECDTEAEGEEG
ncbi:hypothetical protein FQN53_008132 [Emmonsiellopsis sp. PD_33]|nr:hypothetical protein FQN53_008132 [Emmonsiellopsis sp. PD_33]